MKLKVAIFLLYLIFPFYIYSQSIEQCYEYNIIEVPSSIDAKNFEIKVDNGETIEKLKDNNGKNIKFKTRASVIMYFQSLGWELTETTSRSSGTSIKGTGVSTTYTYWIIRKPISKDESIRKGQNAIKH